MITRFAPSPTGPLHLGHAYSAIIGHDRARAAGGTFLLRIEDGDPLRCKPPWDAQIFEDLHWLGLNWPEPVFRVSERREIYDQALDRLTALGLTYPCHCSRRDIALAHGAPQADDHAGPDGPVYAGTCRHGITSGDTAAAVRLDMAAALRHLGDQTQLSYYETGPYGSGLQWVDLNRLLTTVGDIVLFRRDTGMAAYHLTVVVDDAAQGVTEAVRGADLIAATGIHRLLQALLDLPTPEYHHHQLICDDNGTRLAKRHDAKAIAKFRAEGATPGDIRRRVGL